MTPIPANIDHFAIIKDLNDWGLSDFKIETVCGFSRGYVAQLRHGSVQQMSYQRAARLYNLWCEECARRLTPHQAARRYTLTAPST